MTTQLQEAVDALRTARDITDQMKDALARRVNDKGRVSRSKLNELQAPAFVFAHALSAVVAAEAACDYATKQSTFEAKLAELFVAQTLKKLGNVLLFEANEFGLGSEVLASLQAHQGFMQRVLSSETLDALGKEVANRPSDASGALGIGEEHVVIQEMFSQFANSELAPIAEHIHRHDDILPESLIQQYGELGVFGISIPDQYGGSFVDNLAMVLTTEELSRGSLGAGGSVITRPEICAKALLKGGSEAQKQKWLPEMASGQTIVSVAVTEPNAGSDVASLRVTAKRVEGGYLINGEKTWCTFAGRANVFILLARTGSVEDGHKGLTLFLVEKPAKISKDDHHHFTYTQEGGGRCEGSAIPTIGYRGMHSFSVSFEEYFVPEENRVGEEGKGFILQMEGFAGGRIQTAARAVGLMEAALRKAIEYTNERKVFGHPLVAYPLTTHRLAAMAATIMACRQLSYHVAHLMDDGKGTMEASLVKLLACKEAEWVSREAMQLHGGMGYSEEYDVSRYWVDARVLSIFEGAEEVLALFVVARQTLQAHLKQLATSDPKTAQGSL